MSTENKPIALNSTLQSLVTKMQLVSDAFDDTAQSDWAETDATADSYIRNKIETDFWTDATISGNPLSFDTGSSQTAISTKISMEPIQDLHGYDNPWPAGGGKNLFRDIYDGWQKPGSYSIYPISLSAGTYKLSANLRSGKTAITDCVVGFAKSGTTYSDFQDFIICVTTQGAAVSSLSTTITSENSPVLCFYGTEEQFNQIMDAYEIQLEAGSTVTSYAPYSNICPISGRTGVEIDGCGKNLFDSSLFDTYVSTNLTYTTYAIKNGIYTMSSPDFPKGNNGVITNVFFLAGSVSSGASSTLNGVSMSQSITIEVTDGYFTIVYRSTSSGNTNSPKNYRWQIELGTGPTAYEPYQSSNEITISFGETVYGGTLDVEKGELIVNKVIVDLGTLEWSLSGSTFTADLDNVKIPINNSAEADILCEQYITSSINNMGNNKVAISQSGKLWVRDERYIDVTTFKTAMNGVQLVYALTTPRTISITPQQVQLLKGHNTIWTDGDEIELTYINDSKNLTEVNDDFNVITDAIAPMEKNLQSSTHNYVIGDYMLIKGKLHKVTFPILINGEIIIGTNVTPTTIGEELTTALS